MAPRRRFRTRSAPAGQSPRPRGRWLFAALGVAALAATVAVPAIPAAADNNEIIFPAPITGDGSGNLTVTVASDFPLQTLTVHLMSGATDVLDVSDFTDQSTFGFDLPQTYVLASPAKDLATLPPGTYTATADATDTNIPADSVAGVPLTGTFGYVTQPTVTLGNSWTPTFTTTAPNQAVTMTGQLGCLTQSCPIGGWPAGTAVTVTDETSTAQPPPSWTANAATNGSFSVAGVVGVLGDQYAASVAANPTVSLAASSASTQDDPQFLSTNIVATATTALYGLQSIAGNLYYQATGSFTWTAAPANVLITATAPNQAPITALTGSGGAFTMNLPRVTGTTAWQLSSQPNDTASSPFLAQAQTLIDATQLWPTTITGWFAQVNKDMDLTVGGCLATSVIPAPAENPTVQIQYSSSATGPWHVLGTVASEAEPGCSGVVFGGHGGAPMPRAYYRAYFPSGDPAYQSATSGPVLAGLTEVRYYHFATTPHTVAAGKKITVSGTLQYLAGSTWRGYAGQRVLIAFAKRAHATIWYEVTWVKTSKKGTFSVSFADTRGTEYWSADYTGNSTHYPQWAPTIKVVMHGHVKAARTVVPPIRLVRPSTAASLRWPFIIAAQPLIVLLSD